MSIKHIVVQAAGKAEDARRVAMAVDLANRCEATLGGVFLEPAPPCHCCSAPRKSMA